MYIVWFLPVSPYSLWHISPPSTGTIQGSSFCCCLRLMIGLAPVAKQPNSAQNKSTHRAKRLDETIPWLTQRRIHAIRIGYRIVLQIHHHLSGVHWMVPTINQSKACQQFNGHHFRVPLTLVKVHFVNLFGSGMAVGGAYAPRNRSLSKGLVLHGHVTAWEENCGCRGKPSCRSRNVKIGLVFQ